MSNREAKPWKCGGGHVMGLVRRNGSGVRQLLLYREAMGATSPNGRSGAAALQDEGVDVMAVIEGYVADVRCSICGRVRTWVPGAEALQALLRNYQLE